MPLFVVIEEQGPEWDSSKPMRKQRGWADHARFIDALEAQHIIVLGGPLGNTPLHRALLVFDAPDESAVRLRLDEDPWMRDSLLRVVQIHTWELLLGKIA